jgi:hypothetical protein
MRSSSIRWQQGAELARVFDAIAAQIFVWSSRADFVRSGRELKTQNDEVNSWNLWRTNPQGIPLVTNFETADLRLGPRPMPCALVAPRALQFRLPPADAAWRRAAFRASSKRSGWSSYIAAALRRSNGSILLLGRRIRPFIRCRTTTASADFSLSIGRRCRRPAPIVEGTERSPRVRR